MAGFAWFTAAVISVAPLLGWRTGSRHRRRGLTLRRPLLPYGYSYIKHPFVIFDIRAL